MSEYSASNLLRLYTIGHSDLSLESFLDHLQVNAVKHLVDVRSAPASKYVPQFNKASLEKFLKQNQVQYYYAGQLLGGRPTQADVYKSQQVPDKATGREEFLQLVQYTEIMKRDWYQKGIGRLLEIIREAAYRDESVAVMCSEGNPRECHRHHLITRSLIDPNLKVVASDLQVCHILKDGNVELVRAAEFENVLMQPRLF